ncbi:FHA domain-containing protein [bacterium]|nr:FHA domain-containing protein [bacterium]
MPEQRSNTNVTNLSPELGYYLEFLEGNEKGRRVAINKTRIILGRKNGDILVRDIRVSSSHLAVEIHGQHIRVTDLGSSNGTFIEGQTITQQQINLGQAVQIGQTLLCIKQNPRVSSQLTNSSHSIKTGSYSGLSGLIDEEFVQYEPGTQVDRKVQRPIKPEERVVRMRIILGPDKGKKFAIQKVSFAIGRIACDISLNDADVSRKHAIIEVVEGGRVIIRDLASSNGTFVNQERINNKVLNPHDKIQIGKTILLFESAKAD